MQQLCLAISAGDKTSFGDNKDKVWGIIFDGAALWEEYINTIIADKFKHPNNRIKNGGYSLFRGGKGAIYPDFVAEMGEREQSLRLKIQ